VGPAAQAALSLFLSGDALPDMATLFAAAATHALPEKQDALLTLLGRVVEHQAAAPRDVDRYQQAWTVVNRVLMSDQPGLAVAAARALVAVAPNGAVSKATPYGRGLVLAAKHLKGSGVDYGRTR